MIRTELERRPLLLLCVGLLLGLTLARHPAHLAFLLPIAYLTRSFASRACVLSGLVLGGILGPGQPPAMLMERTPVGGDWRITTMPAIEPFGQTCEVERDGVRLQLQYQGGITLCKGSIVSLRAVAKPPKENTQTFFEQRNLVGQVEATDPTLKVVEEGPWMYRVACAWRKEFLNLSARYLSSSDAALMDSMFFHVTGAVDDSTRSEIQSSGTIHLLQSSGLQALLIAQVLFWAFTWLPVPRWAQLLCVACVLMLYVIATGSPPSILRAVTMSVVANSAYLFKREPDWLSALALSSILYLLWFPGGVYEVGFQLSFIGVLFLSAFAQHQKWKPGIEAMAYRGSIRTIRSSVIAYVAIAPLIAYYFGAVSLVAIPVSLLIVVAAAPAVILSIGACAVGWAFPDVGGLILKATSPLVEFIASALNAFGGPDVSATVPAFSAYWLLPYYALILVFWRPSVRQP